jgi:DNA-binding IclR family transcriptional regulator
VGVVVAEMPRSTGPAPSLSPQLAAVLPNDNVSSTVSKALLLLDEFLDGSPGITLSALAARTGIHKTTVLRLCTSLERAGLLEREPGLAYRLGSKVWQLAQSYRRNFRLEPLIRPRLASIRATTGESVSYYVAEGKERICLFRENSTSNIRHHLEEGTRLALSDGVVGRVLMAFMGAQGSAFGKIRKNGYLTAQGREPDTTSVSVPVIDGHSRLWGALVVSGPSFRFGSHAADKALKLLRKAASEISRSLPDLHSEA